MEDDETWTPAGLPAWFWDLLEGAASSRGDFEHRLSRLAKERLVEFRVLFDEAADAFLTDSRLRHLQELGIASEDALDDYSDAVVSQGKGFYSAVFHRSKQVPTVAEWEELPELKHVTNDVYFGRFGESLYEAVAAYHDEHRPGWRRPSLAAPRETKAKKTKAKKTKAKKTKAKKTRARKAKTKEK